MYNTVYTVRVDKSAFEFEWDMGNIDKNKKHGVEDKEAEEVFLDERKKTFKDKLHSGKEERFRVVGKTRKKLRIISARDVNKKEVYLYEETA